MFAKLVRKRELESALMDIQSLTNDNNNLLKQVGSLDAQINKINKRYIDITEELNTAKNQIKSQKAEQAESLDQLQQANHSLKTHRKLFAKTKADLVDLQERYRAAIGSQEQQQTLLLKIQAKLIQASEYYRQHKFRDQSTNGDTLSANVSETLDTD